MEPSTLTITSQVDTSTAHTTVILEPMYWTHYHAGNWVTDHSEIWQDIEWVGGVPAPEIGYPAIVQLSETKTMGYFLPSGPTWMEDPKETLGYDMADCWA